MNRIVALSRYIEVGEVVMADQQAIVDDGPYVGAAIKTTARAAGRRQLAVTHDTVGVSADAGAILTCVQEPAVGDGRAGPFAYNQFLCATLVELHFQTFEPQRATCPQKGPRHRASGRVSDHGRKPRRPGS